MKKNQLKFDNGFIFRKFIYLCKQTHPENVKIEIKDKDFIRNVSKNLICIDMT